MPSYFLRFVHVLVLFLLPLCAGAVWSIAAQISRLDLSFAAFAIALTTLFLRDQLAFLARTTRAVLHALACSAGIVYAQALIAGVTVAGPFGFGLFETLQRMGADMTLALVATRSDGVDRAIYLAAVLLAAAIGALAPRRTALKPRSAP